MPNQPKFPDWVVLHVPHDAVDVPADARDPFVVVIMYSQIAFAYMWDVAVLGARPTVYQIVGAAVIVCGSSTSVILRYRATRAK